MTNHQLRRGATWRYWSLKVCFVPSARSVSMIRKLFWEEPGNSGSNSECSSCWSPGSLHLQDLSLELWDGLNQGRIDGNNATQNLVHEHSFPRRCCTLVLFGKQLQSWNLRQQAKQQQWENLMGGLTRCLGLTPKQDNTRGTTLDLTRHHFPPRCSPTSTTTVSYRNLASRKKNKTKKQKRKNLLKLQIKGTSEKGLMRRVPIRDQPPPVIVECMSQREHFQGIVQAVLYRWSMEFVA